MHIYKYTIPIQDEISEIELPVGCYINSIQAVGMEIFMWCTVDIHANLETRKFRIYGTGWEIKNPEELYYLKTVVMPNNLVWHVFEVTWSDHANT